MALALGTTSIFASTTNPIFHHLLEKNLMPTYLISYDLASANSPEHALLENDITKNIDTQAIKPTESAYLVKSSMSIDQLRDALLSHFKLLGDKLIIVDASKLHFYGGDGLVIMDMDRLDAYGGDGFRKYEVVAVGLKFSVSSSNGSLH